MGKLSRMSFLIVALTTGLALVWLAPLLPQSVRTVAGFLPGATVSPLRGQDSTQQRETVAAAGDEGQTKLKLTAEQVAAAGIDVAAAQGGMLTRRVTVSGSIVPNADHIARVSVKLSGTVAELRKKLGDVVTKDEIVAILESREVADAKSDYLAARLTNELQQDLFERDKALWDKRISNEQQFLRSRNAAAQSQMRLDIARQKLLALGLSETEIVGLPNEPEASLRRQEVRSQIAGRVVERKVDLGTAVGRDNLETELYVVLDLESVWVELAVSPTDLPAIREGQHVTITARGKAACVPRKAGGGSARTICR